MNINFKKIDENFKDLETVESIYLEAFPELKIIPFSEYLKFEKNGDGFCKAVYDDDKLIGYIIYLVFDENIYIENFAISKSYRGKGYGSKVLSCLMEMYREKNPNTVFSLDVEEPSEGAPNLAQRRARIAFYERLGFQLTHIKCDFAGIVYVVMTTMNPINKEDLEEANAQSEAFFKKYFSVN